METRDLGQRYTCFKCGVRFYDLHRPAPLCPRCGADQRESPPQPPPWTRLGRTRVPAAVQPAPAEREAGEGEGEEGEGEELERDELEDEDFVELPLGQEDSLEEQEREGSDEDEEPER